MNFKLVHPFGEKICTFSSFIYLLFRILYLNDEEIYIVKNEFSVPSRKVSRLEYQWASYMDYEFPFKNFRHNFNHPEGQNFFKEAVPDLFSDVTKETFFLMDVIFMVI